MRVEFAVPSPSDSSTDYTLDMGTKNVAPAAAESGSPAPSAPPKNLRRVNTFTGAGNEEEQRNIISLRYRADSMADSVASDSTPDAEAKLWNLFEQVFCFLKGMTIYQTRRRLKFTIVSQTGINSLRIFPIILGLSFEATLPVLILYVTLVLGWHGTKFLVPKFLLSYKIGMQLTLMVDVIWYYKGYNGRLNSVSSGTSVLMQGFFSILLTMLNIMGFMYGWKLRRIVKAVQNQRECDRAALATMMPSPQRGHSLHQTLSVHPLTEMNADEGHSARRKVVVAPGVSQNRQRHSHSGISASLPELFKTKKQREKEAEAQEGTPVFCSNLIITSKYTYYNFLFVFLKMQFSRLANFYTTIVVALCFFDFSPVSPVASLTPLLIVFATSALKDVSEDRRRQKGDAQVNSRPAHIVRRDEMDDVMHIDGMWQDIEVGDVLLLKDGDLVPADCILLATSRSDGRCYVETANLDGETNLKIRQVASCTKQFTSAEEILENYTLEVECDVPNKDLFYFDGVIKLLKNSDDVVIDATREAAKSSLTMDNLILRGSESRNADWTLGLVIYTGKETKVQMNSAAVPLKRSFVEKTLDTMFVLVLMLLFGISTACTLGNNNWNLDRADETTPWYINEDSNGYIFLSYLILFNNLIPLSMYVTMEGVRFVHARYIENDLEIYDTKTDTPAQVRNSNINEDLGQIQYIFSDKTGTLTCNEMIFSKCTIGGLRYNDVDVDPAKQVRPGTRFNDGRLLARLNSNHLTKREIHDFLLLLTICNTVIPETSSPTSPISSDGSILTPRIKYNASSPDEEALVLAAADLGYVLESRDGPFCNTLIQGRPMSFEILNVLEFNSDRKRMSVIVRFPDGSIVLYCKGADDIIFDLLSKSQPQGVAHVTRGHLQEYASEGLRTLTTAVRRLAQEEYDQWNQLYRQAEFSMEGRAAKIANVSALIEVELTLLGATAIEDRLQDGVEESICALRKAGIKFWVLTGDKKETALSIGMSSHVIDDNMDVIVLGQRDKSSLRTRLEELYVDLVEDKWGSDETSSATSVLWEALKRAILYLWDLVKLGLVGRDEEAEARKKRRRLPRRDHAGAESVPAAGNAHYDEVYPAQSNRDNSIEDTFNHNLCDHDFEPKNEMMTGKTDSMSSEDFIDEELEFAMVIDGKTLALVLDDDIKYLFLAVATQCKSVICCRCSPSQKASVVKLVTEPTLMFSPGNITLAIGDGANDVPMIQAANVGVGISGKEGRQAVLSSDYSIAEFQYLKRLLLVHGNYSYKRISKLILFSFMKNVALSMSNFFLAMETMYSGLLMYFSIFFTLYNALFTTIPIVIIAMYNQDVSPAVLMQYPTLYVNGLKNRSFNWLSFFAWCALGAWHAYVVYAVPFFTNGSVVWYFSSASSNIQFDKRDLGLWANGVASYTYLITASTVQVSLMTSNWTRANAISTIGTLVFYYFFTAFFCAVFGWSGADFYDTEISYGVFGQLINESWFWLGLLFSAVVAVLPNYIAKAGRVLFYPEPSHLMREWNRLAKGEDVAVVVDSPRLVRHNTGFAFSHCPGELEMALGTIRKENMRSGLQSNGSDASSRVQSPLSTTVADSSASPKALN
ncbi:p-type atpase (p-atpase) superfamily [Plasmopara halstedii]|uniref:Phospholipid-transporting ATPase n=1 Tax=Plasmopara halstedii TaxID=4781 RepID=A0A0P1AZ78_PLAHL|nr:p-type atpase (p-atpase) superfamily [Plasmopara halstedii]CEG46840.1 p-type atpase (p-atpase) superfamily [Plasmopara halstedii]|eukprot:XP_024583209.1 p-type atpase (p-atpase) superfamily [Plasmopara halstedii]